MVTCQSANQLKTPAKAFLSLQNGLSVWFTRLHNHGENCWSDSCPEDNHWHPSQGGKATNIHCQRSWLFTECCIQSCFPMLTESWVERIGVEEKDAQPTERTAALWGLSSKNYSRIWVNLTRNGLRLGSRHQEPPHTDVSRNLATVVVRGVLPGLRRRRTGLLPNGPKSSFKMRVSFVFHLETKVLESGGRVEKLISQVAWSPVKFPQSVMIWGAMSSAGVGPLCFLKTNVTAPVYQYIFGAFTFPSADQLFKDADFIFQQDLAPVHTAKSTKSWLNDHGVDVLDWPANSPDLNLIENLVKRKMRNKRPKMQISWRPPSKKPGLPYHLSSATNWSPPCHTELRR